MLADRPYMRAQPPRGPSVQWTVTNILLAANVVAFILQSLLGFYRYETVDVANLFALSLTGLSKGYIWQLITFQFLHGGMFHILMNLLVLYFLGRPLENLLGQKRFLWLYLGSGVAGGILQMGLAAAFPNHFGGYVVGASAGVFGLIAAFATMFPDRTFTLLLFFVIPINLRGRTLLWISLGLSIFGIIVPMDGIAHGAHLGGLIAGWGFVRLLVMGQGVGTIRATPLRQRFRRPPILVRREASTNPGWAAKQVQEDLPPEEFISREVDPILEKISEHGIQSLTDRERQILEKARSRMDGR